MKAVNLIPAEHHGANVPVGRSGGAAYAVVALLAGVAILALMYGLASHKISDGTAKLASLNARAAQAQQRASALSPYTSFLSLREQRVQAVNELVGSRFDWASAFYEFGRVLPHNAAITSLNGTVGLGSSSSSSASSAASASSSASSSGEVTSATPPGSIPSFSVTGCAASQSQVAFVLQRLRLINGVHEVQLQSSTKSGPSGGGGSAASGSGGLACSGGEASWAAQVAFEPLPSTPTDGSSGTATTVATPAAGAATPATPSGTSASGSASSTSTTSSTPSPSTSTTSSTPSPSTSTTSSTPSPSAGSAPSGSSAPSSGAAQ